MKKCPNCGRVIDCLRFPQDFVLFSHKKTLDEEEINQLIEDKFNNGDWACTGDTVVLQCGARTIIAKIQFVSK